MGSLRKAPGLPEFSGRSLPGITLGTGLGQQLKPCGFACSLLLFLNLYRAVSGTMLLGLPPEGKSHPSRKPLYKSPPLENAERILAYFRAPGGLPAHLQLALPNFI